MNTNIKSFFILLATSLPAFLNGCQPAAVHRLDLAGEWEFRSDLEDRGIAGQWHLQPFENRIVLPGTAAAQGHGEEITLDTRWTGDVVDKSWYTDPRYETWRKPGNVKVPFWLQPDRLYLGPAWYRKTVQIPDSWQGRRIELTLERCHWESRLWVDGQESGMQNGLGTPHRYVLSGLSPGQHTITLRIDNRVTDINPGPNAHSISDHTQGNWNGIVGALHLEAKPRVFIDEARIFPESSRSGIDLSLRIENLGEAQETVGLKAVVRRKGMENEIVYRGEPGLPVLQPGNHSIDLHLAFNSPALPWDEFNPNVYELELELRSDGGTDRQIYSFGMRRIEVRDGRIRVNGRPVFLRGTLECAIFPVEGHPPTDTASWSRIFRICREHGLNHMRFHSWCPPEAAFVAADAAGIYLHVEASMWANSGSSMGDGKPIDRFLYEESARMLREYGNHPSFCMLVSGNEPAGEHQTEFLGRWIRDMRTADPRRLYSSAAGWPLIPENDFHSTPEPRIQAWGAGLESRINRLPPSSDYDWREFVEQQDRPVVSHEIGQWCVYPDFREIEQYTGLLKPKNFEIFRETLERNGMGHLAGDYLMASGRLQALCYKADIEAALRTPGFGGFQLLDLHDFPGQGTALVGILNALWNEKGYISPEEFRSLCGPTVPLLRLERMVFSAGDSLLAPAELAHYGAEDLPAGELKWDIRDEKGNVIRSGLLNLPALPTGELHSLGIIRTRLPETDYAARLIVRLSTGEYTNSWDIWLYPANPPAVNSRVLVRRRVDEAVIRALEEGADVLLTAENGSIAPGKGGDIGLGFSSIFWNTAWTLGQKPHTLGILCRPEHPALASFPTQFHSNWQWWDLVRKGQVVLMHETSLKGEPIVRAIDDWFTNRSLGLVFEARAGRGRILFTGFDLIEDAENRPVARQLMHSLLQYMNSERFDPAEEIGLRDLRALQQ